MITASNNEDLSLAALCCTDPSVYCISPNREAVSEDDNCFFRMTWEELLTFALATSSGINEPYSMVHDDDMALPSNTQAFYGIFTLQIWPRSQI